MSRAAPDTPAASPRDHSVAALPQNIAFVLHVAQILFGYGRDMIGSVRHRSIAPSFSAIAACFGTASLSRIIAHLNRGILRLTALQRVLLARAAAGKDIEVVERRAPMPPPDRAPANARPEPPAATPLRARRRTPRPAGWDDPELFMPTLQDLERQVRRRPIGRTILDICLDLGVVPGFCHGAFWNELSEIMTWFGGSVSTLMRRKTRRREAFAREQDHKPDANWDWLNMNRDALRQVLGYFIGEPPVDPFDPAAAVATAPP